MLFVGRLLQELADNGDQVLDCANIAQQFETALGVARAQQSQDLFEHARWCGPDEIFGGFAHCGQRVLLDREAESARELCRAQDAHRVFAEAHNGIADGANHFGLDVFESLAVVDDQVARRVKEQRVDREVTPHRILFCCAELVVACDQQVRAITFPFGILLWRATEGRTLEDLGIAVEVQVRQLEAATDDAAIARKRSLDLWRAGLSCDVVVLRCAVQQKIAYATSD